LIPQETSANGIAVDSVNNEIFVMNFQPSPSPIGQPTFSITVFARIANGDVTPLRTIAGNSTDLSLASGLSLER